VKIPKRNEDLGKVYYFPVLDPRGIIDSEKADDEPKKLSSTTLTYEVRR